MSLIVADEILLAAQMSEEELREEIAVMLFERQRFTLAQAARLAGMDAESFQRLLSSRGIPARYVVPELHTLREIGGRARGAENHSD